MTTLTSESAQPRPAETWSLIGFWGGIFVLALVFGIETAVTIDVPGSRLLHSPISTVTYTGLFVVVLVSVIVQLYLRLRCGQRRIENGLRRIEEMIDLRYAEGYTDGSSGRPAAPILRVVKDSGPDR